MGGKRKSNANKAKTTNASSGDGDTASRDKLTKSPEQPIIVNKSIVSAIAVAFVAIFALRFVTAFKDGTNMNAKGCTLSKLYPKALSEEGLIQAWTEGKNYDTFVERVPLSQMTHERFRNEYVVPRKPVVIEGAYAENPLVVNSNDEWSFSAIKEKYGDIELPSYMIPLREGSNFNCSDAGLCKKYNDKTIGEAFDETFMLSLKERKRRIHTMRLPQPYPHDLRLEKVLPDIFNNVYKKMSYFGENLLLGAKKGYDKWPSLFFGPAGTATGIHVDGMGTSFTMGVFRGVKQFILFPKISDKKYLCMDIPLYASKYGIDVLNPNFTNEYGCPTAKHAKPTFATLYAGDILYVPGSTPHAARNLEDSIGLAHNFLTTEDYASHLESGPFGYDSTRARMNDEALKNAGVELSAEFVAMRDLFRLLKETNYQSDWSKEPLFLHPDESRQMAYNRIVQHLETALSDEESAKRYSTRIAFLVANRYIVIALKAAKIWDECLDKDDREHIFVKQHRFPEDDTRNRLSALFRRTQVHDGDCQQKINNYQRKIEEGLSRAAKEVANEWTLSSM